MRSLIPACLAAALALVPPAAQAQDWRGYDDYRGGAWNGDERDDFRRNERMIYRGDLDQRIQSLRVQIDRGVRRGTITRREAEELLRDQVRLMRRLDRARADGWISRREYARISEEIAEQDRRIWREANDRDGRWPRDRWGGGWDRNPWDRG